MGSKTPSPPSTPSSKKSVVEIAEPELDWQVKPEFIYGGPFVKPPTMPPFMDSGTPINIQLQGTFKKSFAYYSLKERMPVILTKVIDYCNRDAPKIQASCGANSQDLQSYIKYVSKLKSDLVTNKNYDLFTVDTPDAKKWNQWIEAQEQKKYFTNAWVFTECYVYRRLREGCELAPSLKNFDPFEAQKDKSFSDNLEPMCIVAEKLLTMLPISEKDKRKADFITLLKICLWSNKCDLSLSAGSDVNLSGQKGDSGGNAPAIDPFQMIIDFKDKLLVDDTGKIADNVVNKAEAIRKAIEGNTTFKFKCSCHRLAKVAGMPILTQPEEPVSPVKSGSPTGSPRTGSPTGSPPPEPAEGGEPAEEPPKVPCPAKMTIAQTVNFDIICDNSGYELFTDLCLAHFLISQQIVDKIRFHVKQIPWFVSDVTPRDFKYVINACANANYNRTIEPEPKEPKPDAEAPAEAEGPRVISAESLRTLGEQWNQYLKDGTFVLMAEDYWTWPHVYRDMKRIDYNMYRKLQYACALLFKGDLNYRKLLGERNCNPYVGFEPSLQGFIPAPIIAVRTVKADLICGLPKGKFDQLMKLDPKWMEKGDYGVIQFCGKAEALKVSDKPCIDYGTTCFSETCPVHTDM